MQRKKPAKSTKKPSPRFFNNAPVTKINHAEAEADKIVTVIKHTVEACSIITRTHKQLITEAFEPDPEINFIQRLAYLYRFHLLISAIAAITTNDKRERFYAIRTKLVHCISSELINKTMLANTQKKLHQLQLTELDKINGVTHEVSCDEIFKCIETLDIYQTIFAQIENESYQPSSQVIEEWLRSTAIPVLNICSKKTASYTHRQTQYDAIRLMILIIGDSCPTRQHKKSFYSDHTYFEFMNACIKLRNNLSHKIHITNNHSAVDLIPIAGKKITAQTLILSDEVEEKISPFNTINTKHTQTTYRGTH
jgi:hypothetical protein